MIVKAIRLLNVPIAVIEEKIGSLVYTWLSDGVVRCSVGVDV